MYNKILCFVAWGIVLPLELKAQEYSKTAGKDTTRTQSIAPVVQGAPFILFKDKTYHFGKVKQGEKIRYSFLFTNVGTEDLFLYEVQTSCGCTASTWTHRAIKPQATSEIEIVFDTANKLGMQNKVVLIISNAQNKEEKLTLTGEVILP